MAYANGVVWLKVRVGTAEKTPDEQELGHQVAVTVNRINGVRSVSVGPTTPDSEDKPLCGETVSRPGNDNTRRPILIDEQVRDDLRNLLFQPYMRGVGYSEFLRRAIDHAHEEANATPDMSGEVEHG